VRRILDARGITAASTFNGSDSRWIEALLKPTFSSTALWSDP